MTKKPSRPDPADFSTVTEWVFDLDNTLYPRRADLFSQIDQKMTGFIRTLLDLDHDAARKLQKQYYRDHGTTLQGLMVNHGIDANDFLAAVHDIDYSVLEPDPALGAAIKALPLTLTGIAPLDEAISTAGGVAWDALDDHFMLKHRPSHFCAGEMIAWDAPTGGYLITACMATGRAAGLGVLAWLRRR